MVIPRFLIIFKLGTRMAKQLQRFQQVATETVTLLVVICNSQELVCLFKIAKPDISFATQIMIFEIIRQKDRSACAPRPPPSLVGSPACKTNVQVFQSFT